MLDAIRSAQAWTGNLSVDDFAADRRTFFAVTRCLEIISEASRRLPPELKQRHHGIAWRDMQDAGNIYRHEYDGVQERIVLTTVREALPKLAELIEAELTLDTP